MRKVVTGIILLLAMGWLFYGCGKGSGDKNRKTTKEFDDNLTESVDEWVLFRSQDFTIKFPPIFIIDTSGVRRSRLVLSTELTDDGDKYRDNIAVLVKERENNLSLQAYGEQCEGYIKQYTDTPEIISSGIKKRNGQEYYQIIYSESQSEFRLIREQQIQFSGNMMYSITLTCEEAVFDQCQEVGEAIMSTLTVK